MEKSFVKRRITALLLCAVMIAGLMPQAISAVMKAAPSDIAAVKTDRVETVSAEVKETAVKEQAATAQKPAEHQPVQIERREPRNASSGGKLYYNLGITPKTAGTVKENWNSTTRILTLTAVPYTGCTFLYWTEYFIDEEDGEEKERLIQDSDPFDPVYSWYVAESGRTVIANFRKNGEFFIWNDSAYSEKGELEVSPQLECVRPGTEMTVSAQPYKDYEVVGIEFGYAVEDGYLGSENVEWEKISDTGTATFRMPASDVWVRAIFRSTLPHTVKLISDDENGTVTFSDGSTTKQIVAGTSVALTVTPAEHYRLRLISGTPENYDIKTHTFEMPDMDLEIHASFTQMTVYEILFTFNPSGDYGSIIPAYNQETGMLTIGALPENASILFVGWYDENGDLLSDEQIYTFYPDRSMTIEVRFTQGYAIYKANMTHGTFELFPERIPSYSSGTTSFYEPGETVRLIATPDDGYILQNYYYVYYSDYEEYQNGNSDLMHKLDGDTFTMTDDSVIIMAAFVTAYDINTSVNIEEAGVAAGSGKYAQGSTVTLTAEVNEGYEFVNWTENGSVISTSATMTFKANANRDLVANYRKLINVSAVSSDESFGTVTGGGAYSPGSQATVTASPLDDYVFVNWTKNGVEVSASAEYTFTAEEDVELTANFRQKYNYTVTAASSNGEYGSVSGGGSVKEGGSVTVTATPATDCYFVNWTVNGSEVSTSASYTFTPDGNVTVTANFEHVKENTVTVTSSDPAYGSVSGGGKFKTGESATVTATPTGDSVFVNWTVNGTEVSTSAVYTFSVKGDTELVANFRQLNSYTVTVSPSDGTYGTVSGGGSYKEGASVTVTASANEGYRFTGWKENGKTVSTSEEYTFTAESDRVLTAEFSSASGRYVITFEMDEDYGQVDPATLLTDSSGCLPYIPEPTVMYEFFGWYYVNEGELLYVTESTVFTKDTRVLAVYNLFDDFYDETLHIYAEYAQYGTASADRDYADFGEIIHLTATPNPGYRFVKWETVGDETGILFSDPYSPTTTLIRGSTGYIYAIFDYDFPDRTFEVDMPEFLETGHDLYFTATITSDVDLTKQIDEFFRLEYGFETDNHTIAGGGPVTILSKTINGNTCVLECILYNRNYLRFPFKIEIELDYGAIGKEGSSYVFHVQLLEKVEGDYPDTCLEEGHTEYWVCQSNSKYYADAEGRKEISLEDTVIHGDHHLLRTAYKAPTITTDGNIEYWACEYCGKYFSDQEAENEVTAEQVIIPALTVYNVRFVDEDGTELQSGTVTEGETPVYNGETPVKAPDAQYTYTFAGWTPSVASATGDATYTATYSTTVNEYTVNFVDEDGTPLQSVKVAYGQTPVYTGETPVKAPDAQYTYTFEGWTPAIAAVTGDATYTATYGSGVNTYEITFSVNGVTETITASYGDIIEAPADPTAEGSDFTGWFTDEECTYPADFTQPVTGNAAFYAGFETVVYTVDGGDSFTWSADNAADLTLTVHRSRNDDTTFDLFKSVVFNGEEVDPSYYTAENGSVKLTVKSGLFENLPGDTYDLTVLFNDGSVTVKVTVEEKTENPPTGEPLQIAVCAVLILSSLAFTAVLANRTFRRKARR